jgi:hypothetical protein
VHAAGELGDTAARASTERNAKAGLRPRTRSGASRRTRRGTGVNSNLSPHHMPRVERFIDTNPAVF